jgi:hypothetical protein
MTLELLAWQFLEVAVCTFDDSGMMPHTETGDVREVQKSRASGHRVRDLLWRIVLYTHLVAAVMWWWMMPGGFPVSHLRFWTNEVYPLLAAAVCLACLFAERRRYAIARVSTAATIPAFWIAATATAAITYPQSAARFLPPALACTAAAAGLFWMTFRRQPIPWRKMMAAVAPAMAIAAAVVVTQRGGDPATSPVGHPLTVVEPNVEARVAALPAHLSDQVDVHTADGRVVLHNRLGNDESTGPADRQIPPLHKGGQGGSGRSQPEAAAPAPQRVPVRSYRLEVEPLLKFESRSPDRCWTIFAPRRDRTSPARQLTALRQEGLNLSASFRDDIDSPPPLRKGGPGGVQSHLTVSTSEDAVAIESGSRLDQPVYSHLNSFAVFTIHGCRHPTLSFSPCPNVVVSVEPSDYPIGRPLRLAYVDSQDVFHVASASSGEKGPFTEFGKGPLRRAESLTITVYDDRQAIFSITLDDWSSQTARSLSPTAGWGLPVNAIEFSRVGDDSSADRETFTIWLTLAGTSVGRGWDSVGHAAGTYRNRIRVRAGDNTQLWPVSRPSHTR